MHFLRYVTKRLLLSLLSLFTVITITFFLMNLLPGDPFLSEKATAETRAALTAKYGLDRPLYVQYGRYLRRLVRGDLGTSYVMQKGRAVGEIIGDSLPVSAGLGLRALFAAAAVGLLLGCSAGLCEDNAADKVIRSLSALGVSVPGYVTAAVLMLVFSIQLGWFPIGYGNGNGTVLPILSLALHPACYLIRMMRSSMIEAMSKDCIQPLRAKGLSEYRVVFVHGLKNAVVPALTCFAPMSAFVLTGSFVTENVFNVPGLGRYFVTGVLCRDYPLIMGIALVYAALYIGMNLVTDILYGIADPRITLD